MMFAKSFLALILCIVCGTVRVLSWFQPCHHLHHCTSRRSAPRSVAVASSKQQEEQERRNDDGPADDDTKVNGIYSSSSEKNDDESNDSAANVLECSSIDLGRLVVDQMKRELLQLGASYNRGFGASPKARNRAKQVLVDLEEQYDINMYNNCSATKTDEDTISMDSVIAPLAGNWRLVWATAQDVLVLEASPVFATGAIYQVFEPSATVGGRDEVTNIIDFMPRAQSLFPPSILPNSLLRAKVGIRASGGSGKYPNRIYLDFESVQFQPLQFLGQNIDIFPPLMLNLPKINNDSPLFPQASQDKTGDDRDRSIGYFDVTYLDDEMLIIRQNAPGGMFALVKVDSIEP